MKRRQRTLQTSCLRIVSNICSLINGRRELGLALVSLAESGRRLIVGAGGEVDSGEELLPRLGRPSIGVVSDDLTKFEPAA